MSQRGRYCIILMLILLSLGCATVQTKDYTNFRTEDPHSILVVPVVNRSVNIDAPDYFLSTCPCPVAERGYYVFPVNCVKRILEDDGLSDADLVHNADPTIVAELFGADSILYIGIEKWEAKYLVLSTTVTVEFNYILKSGKTGETLWESSERMVYQPQTGSSGNPLADLIAQAIVSAIEKAKPSYIPLAQQANSQAVNTIHSGLPAGPYHADYGQDEDEF